MYALHSAYEKKRIRRWKEAGEEEAAE